MATLSFVILLLNAQNLGAEGLGTVGLVVLNITVVVLLCNLVHGGLIYFSSRLNRGNLALIAYAWLLLSLAVYALVQLIYPLLEAQFLIHIYGLGFLQAAAGIHAYFLLGKERIKVYNLISLVQIILLTAFLFIGFYFFQKKEVLFYIQGLYLSYGINYLLAFFFSLKELQTPSFKQLYSDFKSCLHYGFYSQAANTFQLLNYRISYFFLDSFSGRTALGHYTAGVQLSEALLLPGRSISTVQYARISRRKNEQYARQVSIFFMKISWLITLLGTLMVLLVPSQWFQFVLGEEFGVVKTLILYMSLGIVALSAEIVISHYFSGTGRVKVNLSSAAIGFAVTLVACYFLIAPFGAVGAALSTAFSYSAMFLFLFLKMNYRSGLSWSLLLPQKRDFQLIRRLFSRLRKN